MNLFHLKSEEETEKMIKNFWEDLEYLSKIRVLLRYYEGYSITKLEARNINKLFYALDLEKKKDILNNQYKYQI